MVIILYFPNHIQYLNLILPSPSLLNYSFIELNPTIKKKKTRRQIPESVYLRIFCISRGNLKVREAASWNVVTAAVKRCKGIENNVLVFKRSKERVMYLG